MAKYLIVNADDYGMCTAANEAVEELFLGGWLKSATIMMPCPGAEHAVQFSIDHPDLLKEEKLAIILGTEGDGLAATTIADCDYTVKIPMAHGVDSLNVAAASAVAFWQLGNKSK